jgi:hypothetical protein
VGLIVESRAAMSGARKRTLTFDSKVSSPMVCSLTRTQTTARERFMVASGSVAAMFQRFAHVCFRKLGSISIDGGVALLMNTGRSVCDLNRHALSLFNTHSLIKSATIIGGFD